MSKITDLERKDGFVVLGDPAGKEIKVMEEDTAQIYAAITLVGHVGIKSNSGSGKGLGAPCLHTTEASSPEAAAFIIENRNRIKRNGVLGVWQIDKLTAKFIDRVNQLDPLTSKHSSKVKDLAERIVVLPQIVKYNNDYKNNKKFNPCPKVDEDAVKTADQYRDIDVLQRYIAPIRVNGELQFERNINFNDLLEEYIYYSTIIYGKDSSIISIYWQMKGEPNPLQAKYHPNRKIFTWVHPDWQKTITVEVPSLIQHYIDDHISEQKTKAKEQQKKEWTSGKTTEKISAVERFRQRAAAGKKLQEDRAQKHTHDDIDVM